MDYYLILSRFKGVQCLFLCFYVIWVFGFVDMGKNSLVNEGEFPDGESQLDSFAFGMVVQTGFISPVLTTKVSSTYIEDFGIPLKRGLEVLPIGRLGVLFLVFFVYELIYL